MLIDVTAPQPQDAPQLLPAGRVTGVIDRLPVLVQEEAVFVCRQVVQDADVRGKYQRG